MTYFEAMVKLHERFLEEKADVALPPLEGGIVFIGQTVTGKADVGPTPRSAISPLVLIHANLVHNVLTDDLAKRAPEWAVWLGAVLLGYAGVAIGLKRSVWALAAFGLASAGVYVIAAYAVWIEFSVWLPMMAPLLGFAALHFLIIGRRVREEQKGREQVKQMFGTYLSPELLKRMMRDGRNIAAVSSERRPVTILFCDLRDFTSMAEQLKDDALIAQLNEYLAAMVECIHAEAGTLHKFIGDAVMAVWGDLASEGIERDARRAARAALAMQAVLGRLNEAWVRDGKPAFRMGVGLNHGVVLIGNVGSPRRMEFTAIGDAVNLASRLESLNK
ncbi:MAG TPA: adenylate/guanylate cyclase domain-containing protein, partial [Opitutus sp.]|nr:adenylate/guanylate cyclase domain-containing protein [Opitutus sp.]